MGYRRARSKSLESEDDEVKELRAKIQKMQHAHLTFEDRGQKLYSLTTESYRNATRRASEEARKSLPVGEKIQPRFTGLPVELVENIAIRLPAEIFAQLRLSCKTLEVKTRYYFAKKYFISRVVKPEWESIRRLIMIMNSPELGSVVRDVTIDAFPRSPYDGHHLRRHSSPLGVYHLQNLSSLLFRLFDKIPMLRGLNFRAIASPVGTTLETRFGHSKECSVGVLESALDALASSGTPITSLGLGHPDSDCFFHLPDLHVSKLAASASLARLFQNITTLDLAFLTAPGDASNTLSRFLNMTPSVRDLALFFKNVQADPAVRLPNSLHAFHDVAVSADLRNLVNVGLTGIQTPTTEGLRAFLGRSKETLKTVRIVDVQLRERPERRLKAFLGEELALEEARVSGSRVGRRRCWAGDLRLERGVWRDFVVGGGAGDGDEE
ncbi:hypothetical protein EG328_010665 [Venturia inaequalis]|uniref:F-box domain-containing protein n=1 Tax=Venturia inaequalis TaxID=5025 RepID=A0A8H3U8Q6_VENIN|nr:hypothetical protein EG328_010665 [Venturia inaequalis]